MAPEGFYEIRRPRSRPFGLGDAMIFVIAVGLGLTLARPAIALIFDAVRSDPRWRFQTLAGAVSLGRMLNIVLLNFLLFLLPACMIVRLRHPRLSFRSVICQPGFAACAAPISVVVATLPLVFLHASGLARPVIEIAAQILIVIAVPMTWVVLIATRRWNPEPGWIDRLGRILGILWMVCIPAHLVLIRLPY